MRVLMLVFVLGLFLQSSHAQKITHTDYSPTYRTTSTDKTLTHVDYSDTEIAMHICYVAPQNFSELNLAKNVWTMACRLSRGASNTSTPIALKNVRVNNDLKVLETDNTQLIFIKKGDIITFQINFPAPAKGTRLVNIETGSWNGEESVRFQDIMVKNADNRFLGHHDNLATSLKLFYSKQAHVRKKDLVKFTSYESEKQKEEKKQAQKAEVERASQAIDYTPKSLTDIEDIECSKRVVLEDILFDDNSASYAGNVQAHATLDLIEQYMNRFPQAKLILHGHTDVLGNPESNKELSRERVAMVKRSLRMRGVNPDRITILWHGGEQPLPNHDRGGKKNRRVEAEVLCDENAR